MRALFDHITTLSLRFKWVTVTLTIAVMILGIYSYRSLNQEMIPDIEFPQTFIIAQNNGASSDQILAMYNLPIEEKTHNIEGVVNTETNSNDGFGFALIFNEFGLNQEQILAEIEDSLAEIELPIRTVQPPQDKHAADLIGELSPEAVRWLYDRALKENSNFISVLDEEALNALSNDALGALPEEAFDDLDTARRDEIISRRTPDAVINPEDLEGEIPVLPESWQDDPRFSTVEDLWEMTTTRSLANVFNDFVENDYLAGSLGTVHDLAVKDIEIFLDIENRCRDFRAENTAVQPDSQNNEKDPCSFIAELDADAILAMSPEVRDALPDNYLEQISIIDRNHIAQDMVAESFGTVNHEHEDTMLPDSWRAEAPQTLTFSMGDIPLGAISVGSDDLTGEALRELVENHLAPELRDTDLVASVNITGGENIPVNIQNVAFDAESLPPIDAPESENTESTDEQEDTASESADETEASEGSQSDTASETTDESEVAAFPEGPALPPTWAAAAESLNADEMDTADDLANAQDGRVSFIFNMVMATPDGQAMAAPLIRDLSLEAWIYFADVEDGFFNKLNATVVSLMPWDIYSSLDSDIQTQLEDKYNPFLGEPWLQISSEQKSLATVNDLEQAGIVETLNKIETITGDDYQSYLIQLVDSLTPAAIEMLDRVHEGYLSELADSNPTILTYLSRPALQTEAVANFLENREDEELKNTLIAIRDGDQLTAAEAIQPPKPDYDPDPTAPPLPGGWSGIASFVGASELDTADDVMHVPDYDSAADFINTLAADSQGKNRVIELETEHWLYLGDNESGFWTNVSAKTLSLIDQERVDITQLNQTAQNRITAGGESYVPENAVTRTNTSPSLQVMILKERNANTVNAWENVEKTLKSFEKDEDLQISVVFEQSSFITESLSGVQHEGTNGAIMAVIMILIFMNLSIRSTAVISVSIPTSIALAFVMMYFIPSNVHQVLAPAVDNAGNNAFGDFMKIVLRLFPESYTLNIMTLSGLTVAIGRIIDDSIVVLENIYRNIQIGEEKETAIRQGTREVSVAIFAATLTTMVVFIPLGLFGGVVGAFFLPFGLAVAYSLAGSYLVAITIVPVLAHFFINRESVVEEGTIPLDDLHGFTRRWAQLRNIFIRAILWATERYSFAIEWVLRHRWLSVAVAIASLIFGMYLLGNRPVQFLPPIGDPSISVTVALPGEFNEQPISIARTNAKVRRLEAWLLQEADERGIKDIQVSIGSTGGMESLFFDAGIDETAAGITITVEDQKALDALLPDLRTEAEHIFNDIDNDGQVDVNEEVGQSYVVVSGAGIAGGMMGTFAMELKGEEGAEQPALDELMAYNDTVIAALQDIEGMANIELESAAGGANSYIRIDGVPALRYTAEIEADDSIGLTNDAIATVQKAVDNLRKEDSNLVTPIEVSTGFESESQQKGIADIMVSMIIATIIVYLLLTLAFQHALIPIEILVSLPLSVVGAAIGLTVTGRVLGLPAMIGLLMLIGIVVTNSIVLLDRVLQNHREKNMNTFDALTEGGRTRFRPIIMTASGTMIALVPLAASTGQGLLIAAELGTVVVGGMFSSTILTLLLVPVVHSLFADAIDFILGLVGMGEKAKAKNEESLTDSSTEESEEV